jgi:hypothetical protein
MGSSFRSCLSCGHLEQGEKALCSRCEKLRPLIENRIVEQAGSRSGLNEHQIVDDLALYGVSATVARCCLLVLLIEGKLQENKA